MTKMGRPKSPSPKKKSIGIRLSDSDYEKLKQYAAEHNQTITQAVQQGIARMIGNSE